MFDNEGVPQITDFGISSITLDPYSNNASTAHEKSNLRWAAPEILEAPQNSELCRPTRMSDVYAFAMVVIEVKCHHHSYWL